MVALNIFAKKWDKDPDPLVRAAEIQKITDPSVKASAIALLAEYFLTVEHSCQSAQGKKNLLAKIWPHVPEFLRSCQDCLDKNNNKKEMDKFFALFCDQLKLFLIFDWPASTSEPYSEMLTVLLELLDYAAVTLSGWTVNVIVDCVACFGKRSFDPLFLRIKNSDPRIVSAALMCTHKIKQNSNNLMDILTRNLTVKEHQSWDLWSMTCNKLREKYCNLDSLKNNSLT
jgi:hypothetical protein